MPETTKIESATRDREVTLEHYPFTGSRVLMIEDPEAGEAQFAFLTPKGARDLIDALEDFAAPVEDQRTWGPKISGTTVYTEVKRARYPEGTLVRITRPGQKTIVKPVRYHSYSYIPFVVIDGKEVHFRDHANGMVKSHNWVLEFEVPEPEKPSLHDQYLSLEPGTRFRTHPTSPSTFTKINDEKLVREANGLVGIYGFGETEFGYWKDPRQTGDYELEVL